MVISEIVWVLLVLFTYFSNVSSRCEEVTELDLTFPDAGTWNFVFPNELCLRPNYMVVTRQCLRDGWGPIKEYCSELEIDSFTIELHTLCTSPDSDFALNRVHDIIYSKAERLKPVDIVYTAQYLYNLLKYTLINETNIQMAIDIINKIMEIKDYQMEISQEFSYFMGLFRHILAFAGSKSMKSQIPPHTKFYVANTEIDVGIMVKIMSQDKQIFTDLEITNLHTKNLNQKLKTSNFDFAVTTDATVARIQLFQNHKLFISKNSEIKPNTSKNWIVGWIGWSVGQITATVYFKKLRKDVIQNFPAKCARWNFTNEESTLQNNWVINSNAVMFRNNFYQCQYHFHSRVPFIQYFTIFDNYLPGMNFCEEKAITMTNEHPQNITFPQSPGNTWVRSVERCFEEDLNSFARSYCSKDGIWTKTVTVTNCSRRKPSTADTIFLYQQCKEVTELGLTFPAAEAWAFVFPNELCLKPNYMLVTRQCQKDDWGSIKENCSQLETFPFTTKLHAFLNTTSSAFLNFFLDEIRTIIYSNAERLNPVDIAYTAQYLYKHSEHFKKEDMGTVVDIINKIMEIEKYHLEISQEFSYFMELLRYSLLYTVGCKIPPHSKLYLENTETDVGITVKINGENKTNFTNLDVMRLNAKNFGQILKTSNFDFAITAGISNASIQLFQNDILFISKDSEIKRNISKSWIIGWKSNNNWANYSDIVTVYLKQFVKNVIPNYHPKCARWNFQYKENTLQNNWVVDGNAVMFENDFYQCQYHISTHSPVHYFTLLDNNPSEMIVCEGKTVTTTNATPENITFPQTPVNTWTASLELCFQEDYSFARSYCSKDGIWTKTEANCSTKKQITTTTQILHNLTNSSSVETLENITSILRLQPKNLQPVDIHLVSAILQKASQNANNSNYYNSVASVVDQLVNIDKNVLQSSQEHLNSTDIILYSLDKALLNIPTNATIKLSNLLIHAFNSSDKIMGIMITCSDKVNLTSCQVDTLLNNYQKILKTANFDIACIVPQDFSLTNQYSVTLFPNDNLFNEETQNAKSIFNGWVISLLITDFIENSNHIEIYFKGSDSTQNQSCNFWNYGIDADNIPISGHWRNFNKAEEFRPGFYLCKTNHTTHFGMLVSDSIFENKFLDYLTIVGATLSILSVIAVLVHAICFKKWMTNKSNQIVLNISVCILLLIVFFFVSDLIEAGVLCIVVGICLHYMVIAQFCWALVISYTNYRRLYMNLHYHISMAVIKYCTFSWGVPLVVVGIVAGLNIQTYNKIDTVVSSSQLCYPKKNYLLYGLYVPVGVILTINLIIYLAIVTRLNTMSYDIRTHKKTKSCNTEKSMLLMFFVMGLTWIFGFLAAFINDIVFASLFCICATCHGFVYFVFYVLKSSDARKMWAEKLQKTFRSKSKHYEKAEFYIQNSTEDSQLESQKLTSESN